MFDTDLFAIFLGAQVHRTKTVAQTFKAVHVHFDCVMARDFVGINRQLLEERIGCCLQFLADTFDRRLNGFTRGVTARLGGRACFAGIRGHALGLTFGVHPIA